MPDLLLENGEESLSYSESCQETYEYIEELTQLDHKQSKPSCIIPKEFKQLILACDRPQEQRQFLINQFELLYLTKTQINQLILDMSGKVSVKLLVDLKELKITNAQNFKIWKNNTYVLKMKNALKIVKGGGGEQAKVMGSYDLMQ